MEKEAIWLDTYYKLIQTKSYQMKLTAKVNLFILMLVNKIYDSMNATAGLKTNVWGQV